MSKSIFYKGKIYQGVEKDMPQPFEPFGAYMVEKQQWEQYLSTLKSFDCPTGTWRDGTAVVEGKDYELQFRVLYSLTGKFNDTKVNYTRSYPSESANSFISEIKEMSETNKKNYRYDIVALPLKQKCICNPGEYCKNCEGDLAHQPPAPVEEQREEKKLTPFGEAINNAKVKFPVTPKHEFNEVYLHEYNSKADAYELRCKHDEHRIIQEEKQSIYIDAYVACLKSNLPSTPTPVLREQGDFTDTDPICSTELFKELKWYIGQIQMEHLKMRTEGMTVIEANPATHRIAKYVYALLSAPTAQEPGIKILNLCGDTFELTEGQEVFVHGLVKAYLPKKITGIITP